MKRILIIDDEADFCSFVKEALEITGKYKVSMAVNGSDGIRLARDNKPDLILLDISLPVMDGLEVLKRLKDDDKTVSIPVVMVTVKTKDEFKEKAAELYTEDYLVKPVRVTTLRSSIEAVLERKHAGFNAY